MHWMIVGQGQNYCFANAKLGEQKLKEETKQVIDIFMILFSSYATSFVLPKKYWFCNPHPLIL